MNAIMMVGTVVEIVIIVDALMIKEVQFLKIEIAHKDWEAIIWRDRPHNLGTHISKEEEDDIACC